jgi:hypothetical protein
VIGVYFFGPLFPFCLLVGHICVHTMHKQHACHIVPRAPHTHLHGSRQTPGRTAAAALSVLQQALTNQPIVPSGIFLFHFLAIHWFPKAPHTDLHGSRSTPGRTGHRDTALSNPHCPQRRHLSFSTSFLAIHWFPRAPNTHLHGSRQTPGRTAVAALSV